MEMKQEKTLKETATAARPWNFSPEITKEDWISWIKWLLSYTDKEETAFIYNCISAYLTSPARNARFKEKQQ